MRRACFVACVLPVTGAFMPPRELCRAECSGSRSDRSAKRTAPRALPIAHSAQHCSPGRSPCGRAASSYGGGRADVSGSGRCRTLHTWPAEAVSALLVLDGCSSGFRDRLRGCVSAVGEARQCASEAWRTAVHYIHPLGAAVAC
jgi:hypothetical protein